MLMVKSLPYLLLSRVFLVVPPARLTRKAASAMLKPYVATKIRNEYDVLFFPNPRPNLTTEKLKDESGGISVLAELGYIECVITPGRKIERGYIQPERIIP